MTGYMDALQRVIDDVVEPQARVVDEERQFPAKAVEALGGAGILGLTTSAEMGGGGQGMRPAAEVIEAPGPQLRVDRDGRADALRRGRRHRGPRAGDVRRRIGAGRHLTTLAFSEAGSRSHFWAPVGTATADGDRVRLDARKSWVTSAAAADSYVWSSRPVAAEGPMTLWLVPSTLERAQPARVVRRSRSAGQRVGAGRRRRRPGRPGRHARSRRRRPGHRPGRSSCRGSSSCPPPSRSGSWTRSSPRPSAT